MYENQEAIKKLLKTYIEPPATFITKQGLVKMFIRDCGVPISEVELITCVGMCKMTVVNETMDYKRYRNLRVVEFYELLGRVADNIYR